MKKNQTRRALLMSVLSLLLCVSMLVGTTFAWFTDTVESGKNQIIAGNLDIELYWSTNAKDWNKVTSETNVFAEGYWEPGKTEVVYLKVVNEGTLALKYNLSVYVATETPGINVDDKVFKLSDHIQFGVASETETVKFPYALREDAREAVAGSATKLNVAYNSNGSMTKKGEETVVALVVYMPESVGNEANYKTGTTAPTIDLGIKLLATQYTYEEDSFGDDYDKDAAWTGAVDTKWYDDAPAGTDEFTLTTAEQLAGLAQIVNSGKDNFNKKTVKLAADIDLNNINWTPIGTEGNYFQGSFDGEKHTISNLYVTGTDGVGLFGYTASGTHIEEVNVVNAYVSGNNYVGVILGHGYLSTNCIKNCTVEKATVIAVPALMANGEYDGGAKAGVIAGFAVNGHIIGNTVKDSTVTAYRDLGGIVGWLNGENHPVEASDNNLVGTVTLNYIGVAGTYAEGKANGNMNAIVGRCGSNVTVKENEGEASENKANEGAVAIYTLEELIAFAKAVNAGNTYAGKTVILGADIDLLNMEWTPINGFKGTFDGNGKTVSNLKITGTANNAGFFGYADNANIQNLTIENAHVSGADCVGIIAGQVYSVSKIDNCHVKGEIQVVGYTNVGGITGKYYTKVSNCSVIGAEGKTNFVKGVYLKADLEGDNVGGIMGHCGENNNLSGNTVKNITVSGTRKVGGIIGIADQNTEINDNTVENVVIETSATKEYANDKITSMSISALIGQYQAAGSNPDGTVIGNTIKNVSFNNVNDAVVSIGALTGGSRGGSNGMKAPSDAIKVADNVIENVVGTNNDYLFGAVVNGVKYQTAADAIAAAPSGATITLLKSETVSAPIEVEGGKELTINLNGKTLSGAFAKGSGALLTNKGTLTIVGGTVKNTTINGDGTITNEGTLTLNGAAIVGAPIADGAYPEYAIGNYGKLTVEAGSSVISDRGAIYMNGGSDVVINGGNFAVTDALGSRVLTAHVICAMSNSKLTINDGNFALNYAAGKSVGASVICPWGGTINIYGGNFSYAGETGGQSGIFQNYMGAGSVVNVYGGTFDDSTVNKNLAAGYQVTEENGIFTVKPYEVSSTDDLKEALANGKAVILTQDINLGKIDLTGAITNDVVIDANGHKITTTEAYGIEATPGKNITISNADIVMTKKGDYITYAAGFKIANGDYAGATITLQNCTITMANTDWAYAVNMPASVKNLNLVIDNCTLEGAVAVQCWGDNNTITITNSELICNYTTSALYTSYCVVLQAEGSNISENNKLVIDNCEFKYSGVDNFNSPIYSVTDRGEGKNGNTVTVTNCTYGEKVVAD